MMVDFCPRSELAIVMLVKSILTTVHGRNLLKSHRLHRLVHGRELVAGTLRDPGRKSIAQIDRRKCRGCPTEKSHGSRASPLG